MAFWQPGWKLWCHKSKIFMFQVRKKRKLTTFQKFFFIRNMIHWRLRVQFAFLIPLPKTFSPSTVNVRSECWKFFKKREIFQKFDFLFDLTRRRLQFSILISLPKTFLPSTVIVRSKFWRSWQKREFSKNWFFDWYFETKTAIFNFDIPAENFFAKHDECSFKNLKKLKKKRLFKKLTFWFTFWDEDCNFQFWYPCPKLFRLAR